TLSGEQKQRLNLALALVPDPLLVLLDEPTSGPDPIGRAELLGTVRGLAADGRAVLMTTPDLGAAERACDRLAVLDRGHLVATGTVAELLDGGSLTVVEGEASIALAPVGDRELCSLEIEGTRFRCRTADPTGVVRRIADLVESQGGALVTLRVGEARLEDVVLDLLGRSRS